MKSPRKPSQPKKTLQELSLSIGEFIRYWGFRRIHGALWCQLYLANEPLSCTELSQRLGLSKALVSPALEELCQHKVIVPSRSPNEKTKLYEASKAVEDVIRHVLRTRESPMLKQISANFSALKKSKRVAKNLDENRLRTLEEMIKSAQLMLALLIECDDFFKFPSDLEKP